MGLALLAAGAGPGQGLAQDGPDYVLAAANENVALGFDRSRLAVGGTEVVAWIVGVRRDPPAAADQWDHIVYWSVYDCDGWRGRRAFAEEFDAQGELMNAYPVDADWQTFEEGSLGEGLVNAVCIGEPAIPVTAGSDRDFAARGRRYLTTGTFD